MNVTEFQRTEGFELIRFDFEGHIGIGESGFKSGPADAYDLIIVFDTEQLDPFDVMLNRIGMRNLFADDDVEIVELKRGRERAGVGQ